ncbi:hypothetical protein BKA62DRAFT_776395 [Auriculariales sp. MPI-PUGE-AT-0066]|nr:hypothetical protein BKA62DRAFT_776395 [Auriculariales sp. MPI-PUGE-AT-0066]
MSAINQEKPDDAKLAISSQLGSDQPATQDKANAYLNLNTTAVAQARSAPLPSTTQLPLLQLPTTDQDEDFGRPPSLHRPWSQPGSRPASIRVPSIRAPSIRGNLHGVQAEPVRESHSFPWEPNSDERYHIRDPIVTIDNDRIPADKLGTEAAEDARVWRIYKKRAGDHSQEHVRNLQASINNLPVFAGLFSAVSTTFLVEGYRNLQPDYMERLESVIGSKCISSPTVRSLVERALACKPCHLALRRPDAIVAQQWLEEYTSRISGPAVNHKHWVRRHRVLSDGFERWKIELFISALPLLLHISLLLFFIGLVLFFWPLDNVAATFVMTLAILTFAFYVGTTIAPLIWRVPRPAPRSSGWDAGSG